MSNWVVTGDGAIFASIRDLAKWDQNFYQCKVGGPQWGKQMLVRGRLNDGTTLDYAFVFEGRSFQGTRSGVAFRPLERLSKHFCAIPKTGTWHRHPQQSGVVPLG